MLGKTLKKMVVVLIGSFSFVGLASAEGLEDVTREFMIQQVAKTPKSKVQSPQSGMIEVITPDKLVRKEVLGGSSQKAGYVYLGDCLIGKYIFNKYTDWWIEYKIGKVDKFIVKDHIADCGDFYVVGNYARRTVIVSCYWYGCDTTQYDMLQYVLKVYK